MSKISVLLVDDDEGILKVAKYFLETRDGGDFTIDGLADPSLALAKIKAGHYDCIVCDYQMTPLDGLDVLSQLRATGDTTPFVMFTGRSREEVVIEALNLGADHYITKGGEPESQFKELAHIIRTLVAHKEMERAWQESEARVRAILDAIPDLLFELDPEGRFLSYKGEPEDLFRKPEEFLGRRIDEVLPQKQAELAMILVREVAGTQNIREFNYHLEIKGERKYFEARMAPSGPNVLALIRDVSRQRMYERSLRENEERFRNMVEWIPLPIMLVAKNDQVEYVNPQFVKTFGYTIEDIPTLDQWREKAYPNPIYRAKVQSIWDEDLKGDQRTRATPKTFEVQCKDGKIHFTRFQLVDEDNRAGRKMLVVEQVNFP